MIEQLGFLSGHGEEFFPKRTATIEEILGGHREHITEFSNFVGMLTRGVYGEVAGDTTIAGLMEIGERFTADLLNTPWKPVENPFAVVPITG